MHPDQQPAGPQFEKLFKSIKIITVEYITLVLALHATSGAWNPVLRSVSAYRKGYK